MNKIIRTLIGSFAVGAVCATYGISFLDKNGGFNITDIVKLLSFVTIFICIVLTDN